MISVTDKKSVHEFDRACTAGIFQCNSIQLAILQDLIGQIFATELDFIGKCPQWVSFGSAGLDPARIWL